MAHSAVLSGVALVAMLAFGLVSGMESWKEKLLAKENENRAKHGSDPLQYNEELEARAQEWADTVAATMCTFEKHHAPHDHPGMTYRGEPLGENINRGQVPGGGVEKVAIASAPGAAGNWYKERKYYNYETGPQSGPDTGHFTQQVWKGTREVGYALVTCNDELFFLFARYYPTGNIDDGTGAGYRANVLPPQ